MRLCPYIMECCVHVRSFCIVTSALPSRGVLALPPLVIAMSCGVSNAAAPTNKYPRMAAIGQYQMEEILNRGTFLIGKDGPEILFDVVVPLTILTLAGRHALHEKQRGV